MYDNAVILLRVFVITALSGLAFGILVKVFFSFDFGRRDFSSDETDNAGAEEGDQINHREVTK
jgi:hypothetical protein